MDERIVIRLFYIPVTSACCPGGGCGCSSNADVDTFSSIAEKLVEKFGEERLEFEAYNSVDLKKFPFLREGLKTSGKLDIPVVTVGKKIFSTGKIPSASELEIELSKDLN
jgi:hypothetical protein